MLDLAKQMFSLGHYEIDTVICTFLADERRGFFITDAGLQIVWATPQAVEAMRACSIVDIAVDPKAQRLRKSLQRLLVSGNPEHGFFCCPNMADDSHLLVQARRIQCDAGMYIAGYLYLSNNQEQISLGQLGAAYQLTGSEEKVVQLLFNGASPTQIAKVCKVSAATVRTQLKSAYRKIGISNKEMLFRKIRPFIKNW